MEFVVSFEQMWPSIIQNAKDGGADVVQTYVFWNGHEPKKGQVRVSFTFCLVIVAQEFIPVGINESRQISVH